MVIRTNIAALQLHRNWQQHTTQVGKAIERLSSGLKINRAADDASGLAISKKMQMQLALLREEQAGAMNSISSHEIADSALDQMQQLLRRMGELAGRAANGTMDGFDRLNLDKEYQQLLEELDRMSPQTAVGANLFSGRPPNERIQETLVFQGNNLDALLDGLDSFMDNISSAVRDGDQATLESLGIRLENGMPDETSLREATSEFIKENAAKLLDSPNNSGNIDNVRYNVLLSDSTVFVEAQGVNADWLSLTGSHVRDADSAGKAMDALRTGAERLSARRGEVGAAMNRLEHTANRLSAMEVDLMTAISRITDADMAQEMMNLVKAQVLEQVTALLSAHEGRRPETVLRLLDASIIV